MTRRFFPFLPYILWSVIILLTIDLASAARKWVAETVGNQVYDAVYFLIAVATIWAVVRFIRSEQATPGRFILALSSGTLFFLALSRMPYAVEKIHYAEYGLLSVFAFRALSPKPGGLPGALLALMMVFFTGLLDEWIQALHPDRVGEIRDVLTDLFAGLLGLLLYLSQEKTDHSFFRFSVPAWRAVAAALGFSILLSLAFIEQVHGFGFKISGPDHVAFFSSLSEKELSEPGARRDVYDNEAQRHAFQRDFYRTHRFKAADGTVYFEHGKSWKENLVLERCYSGWLNRTGEAWDAQTREEMRRKGEWFMPTPWHSRVKEGIIVSTPAWIPRSILLLAGALCFTLLFHPFLRKRPFRSDRIS